MIQTTVYFTEDQGDICVLRLRPLDEVVFGNFDAMQSLFDLLQNLHRRLQRVLLIDVQSGVFSPEVVNRFWKADLSAKPAEAALMLLKRVCRHIDKDLATYLRNSRTGFNNLPG